MAPPCLPVATQAWRARRLASRAHHTAPRWEGVNGQLLGPPSRVNDSIGEDITDVVSVEEAQAHLGATLGGSVQVHPGLVAPAGVPPGLSGGEEGIVNPVAIEITRAQLVHRIHPDQIIAQNRLRSFRKERIKR